MSTQYKILTKGLNLTRFAGGNSECHLSINKYVSYNQFYNVKLSYKEVVTLREDLINSLRKGVFSFELCKGFDIDTKQVKTLITDLHIYLNDNIHKKN